jgi:hypothetical protein
MNAIFSVFAIAPKVSYGGQGRGQKWGKEERGQGRRGAFHLRDSAALHPDASRLRKSPREPSLVKESHQDSGAIPSQPCLRVIRSTHHWDLLQRVCGLCDVALRFLDDRKPPGQARALDLDKYLCVCVCVWVCVWCASLLSSVSLPLHLPPSRIQNMRGCIEPLISLCPL